MPWRLFLFMSATKMTSQRTLAELIHDGVRENRAATELAVKHQPIGGLTGWRKGKVNVVSAPLVAGAQARTIRLHEVLHANHSPTRVSRKFHPLTVQAVEDARVHSIYWRLHRLPHRANRDCMAAALTDLRALLKYDLADHDQWNLAMLIGLRALSIAHSIGNADFRYKLESRLSRKLTLTIFHALEEVLSAVRNRSKASKLFEALLRADKLMPAEGDTLNESRGAETRMPMRIVRLPLVEPCHSAAPVARLASSGSIVHRPRLVRALIQRSTVGLFRRRVHREGGTVLLDASGSMGIDSERLSAICRALPFATVAYYDGWGSCARDGAYGELCIFAERGLRASSAPIASGGNEVDLYAIRWLLAQPGPSVLVTDGEFCGGPVGQDIEASKLLASAVAQGQIRWLRSFSELSDHLGLIS